MAQQFKTPATESELRWLQDELYAVSKGQLENGDLPRFKGLIELMSSETVILTAIHNLKSNKGSETPGVDKKTMRADILEKDYGKVITHVQEAFTAYKPKEVRRQWIPKPGKTEKRPLGIPAIEDRICLLYTSRTPELPRVPSSAPFCLISI